MTKRETKRHWRYYKTSAGTSPVKTFIAALTDDDAAAIVEGMQVVRIEGLSAARHLRGDVYEVRVSGRNKSYRILFATEGRFSHVLLAVHAIEKRTQRTPPREIELADTRLQDWRRQGLVREGDVH